MIRVRSVRRAAVAVGMLLLAGVAGVAGAEAAPPSAAPAVKIKVMRVRASGIAAPGTTPEVDASLGKLPIARLRGGHAKYALEQTVENPLAWGQALTMAVAAAAGDAGGRFEVVPVAAGAKGALTMRIEERMPDAGQPCLTVNSEVQAARPHLFFCDVAIDGATILFFVTAELLAP